MTEPARSYEKTLSLCQNLRQGSDGHFDTLSELFPVLAGL
jgi:hypothetical protein